MRLKAYAKINLYLKVLEQLPDGFHDIESLMQSVSLCDFITLTPISSGIEVVCDNPSVPQGKENIAYKAAEVFLKFQDQREKTKGMKIYIEKHIPMAAGLAGGSADAAAVLLGLNHLSTNDSPLTSNELLKLAEQIGSDVPFCLIGGTCLVKGRGEILQPQEARPKTYYILVTPNIGVSTKWAYQAWDQRSNPPTEDKYQSSKLMFDNYLEPVVATKYPKIKELKERLLSLGCSKVQMSGSGPSVFGQLKDQAEGEPILQQIKKEYQQSFLVETVDQGVLVV